MIVTKLFRLIEDYIRKNKNGLFFIILIFAILININLIYNKLNVRTKSIVANNKDLPIFSDTLKFPNKINTEGKELINKFLNYAKEEKYDKALEMLDKENLEQSFENKYEAIGYIKEIYGNKMYDVRAYSKKDNHYIFQVKVFDDFLATGLTDSKFNYYDSKIVIKNDKGNLKLRIKGYIETKSIKGMYEDNNLKVELLNKRVWETKEIYTMKITNRTGHTLVVSDHNPEAGLQIGLDLGKSKRKNKNRSIISLAPYETKEVSAMFDKFSTESTEEYGIILDTIRIYKKYQNVGSTIYDNNILNENKKNLVTQYSITINIEKNERK